ncbi:MAG: flavodoxin domain-containing protein, partial [Syntrophales bacterium]|nr:flavodoxin domain-containing protein [Syntrophales bacterium]
MFSYLPEEEILFSHDAFGMHLASAERFDDEIDPALLQYEGATYFANILLPYSPLVTRLLGRVGSSGMTFKYIAPDHGPVWRKDIGGIIGKYGDWAAQKPTRKAVVVYGTMWHSTELMARAISEGLADGGAIARCMSLDVFHRSDVAYEILDAGALVIGSSTLNNNILPPVADVLTYLKGLRPVNIMGASFGSYGWSGEAPGQIADILKEMKIEVMAEPIKVQHVPRENDLARCYALGEEIALQLRRNKEVA